MHAQPLTVFFTMLLCAIFLPFVSWFSVRAVRYMPIKHYLWLTKCTSNVARFMRVFFAVSNLPYIYHLFNAKVVFIRVPFVPFAPSSSGVMTTSQFKFHANINEHKMDSKRVHSSSGFFLCTRSIPLETFFNSLTRTVGVTTDRGHNPMLIPLVEQIANSN